MQIPKIKLSVLGQMPPGFDVGNLLKWRSDVFSIDPNIESYQLNEDAAGAEWEFTDEQFDARIRPDLVCSFQITLVSVKLEQNWYLRRLPDNRIVLTFYELDQILRFYSLPLENLALRAIYATTLLFKRYGDRFPSASEPTDYAHDETRGCLFDMNPAKVDVIHSLHQPKVCEFCVSQLKRSGVSNEVVKRVQAELRRIRKPLLDRLVAFVRTHTVWSIVISFLSAIVIGTLTSLIAAYLYGILSAIN